MPSLRPARVGQLVHVGTQTQRWWLSRWLSFLHLGLPEAPGGSPVVGIVAPKAGAGRGPQWGVASFLGGPFLSVRP